MFVILNSIEVYAAEPKQMHSSIQFTESCTQAKKILDVCSFETTCGPDMSLFLPSAARSNLNILTDSELIRSQAFSIYCEQVCNSKSAKIDFSEFEKDVCFLQKGIAKPTPQVNASISIIVDNFKFGSEKIDQSIIQSKFGHPISASPSHFNCDSAFDTDRVQLLEYSGLLLESDGKSVVLRKVDLNKKWKVTVEGLPIKTMTRDGLKSLTNFETLVLKKNLIRVAPKSQGSLETGYDFLFDQDRLISISYWIGC